MLTIDAKFRKSLFGNKIIIKLSSKEECEEVYNGIERYGLSVTITKLNTGVIMTKVVEE